MKPTVPANIHPDISNRYQTNTTRMLEQAIKPNSSIKEFDEIRTKLKQNANSNIYMTKYLNVVTHLEVSILLRQCKLKEKLKFMERITLLNR